MKARTRHNPMTSHHRDDSSIMIIAKLFRDLYRLELFEKEIVVVLTENGIGHIASALHHIRSLLDICNSYLFY